jgi:hypothetical protein
MKKLLLALLLTVVSASAMAEWTAIGGTDETDDYIDMSTKRKIGNKVNIWALVDFKIPQNDDSAGAYLSQAFKIQCDCVNENYKFLSITNYAEKMQKGKVVSNSNYNPEKSEPFNVMPNSVMETKFKLACGKR